jgi:hypothetical protein
MEGPSPTGAHDDVVLSQPYEAHGAAPTGRFSHVRDLHTIFNATKAPDDYNLPPECG